MNAPINARLMAAAETAPNRQLLLDAADEIDRLRGTIRDLEIHLRGVSSNSTWFANRGASEIKRLTTGER